MKNKIVAAVLGVIMTLNFLDVLTDIKFGVPAWHIFNETLIVVASGGVSLIYC